MKIEINPKKIVAGAEVERTCYFLQLIIVASSVRNRNNAALVRGNATESHPLAKEILVEDEIHICQSNPLLLSSEIPQEVQILSNTKDEHSKMEAKAKAKVLLEDLGDCMKAPLSAFNQCKDNATQGIIGSEVENIFVDPAQVKLLDGEPNLDETLVVDADDSLIQPIVATQTIDHSIKLIAHSSAKMGTMIMGFRSVCNKMQKEKEFWKGETARVMRELTVHRERAEACTGPIKKRIQELDREIAESKK